jgi:hypothetical protein
MPLSITANRLALLAAVRDGQVRKQPNGDAVWTQPAFDVRVNSRITDLCSAGWVTAPGDYYTPLTEPTPYQITEAGLAILAEHTTKEG